MSIMIVLLLAWLHCDLLQRPPALPNNLDAQQMQALATRYQRQLERTVDDLAQLASLRNSLLRMILPEADLQSERIEPLIDATSERGTTRIRVAPLFFARLPIQFEVAASSTAPGSYTLQAHWVDGSAHEKLHTFQLEIEPKRRTVVLVMGEQRRVLPRVDFRIVLPTRPQVLVAWKGESCHLLVINGFERYQVVLDGKAAPQGEFLVDEAAELGALYERWPEWLTAVPAADEQLTWLIGGTPIVDRAWTAYDAAVFEHFGQWSASPVSAGTKLQTQVLSSLRRLEAIDAQIGRKNRPDAPAATLALWQRRNDVMTALLGSMTTIGDDAQRLLEQSLRLRVDIARLQRVMASQLQQRWLSANGAYARFLREIQESR